MTKKNFKTVKEAAKWLNDKWSDGPVDFRLSYIKNTIEVEGKEMYLSNIKECGDTGRNRYIVFFDHKDSSKFEVIEVAGLLGSGIAGKEQYNYFYGPSKQLVNSIRHYTAHISEFLMFETLENFLMKCLRKYIEAGYRREYGETAYVEYLIMQEVIERQETDEQIN